MDEKSRIEKIMQTENLNSAQFAIETGIQTSTLSHILNGRNKVSLKVLQQILNRFRTISSDWLILGIGPMYRQEKNSQTPTLFDFDTEIYSESNTSIIKNDDKTVPEKDNIQQKMNHSVKDYPIPLIPHSIHEAPPRKIKRIIVYFDDNSFQEFGQD